MVSPADLKGFLKKHKQIGLDSNLLIYFIEAHPDYFESCQTIFQSIESGRNIGICSTLTLMEVLVQPYRRKNSELVHQFYGLLTSYPHLKWIELSVEIADLGAKYRAKYQLKTPDSILLATAVHAGASAFIGNDSQMKRLSEIEMLILCG